MSKADVKLVEQANRPRALSVIEEDLRNAMTYRKDAAARRDGHAVRISELTKLRVEEAVKRDAEHQETVRLWDVENALRLELNRSWSLRRKELFK